MKGSVYVLVYDFVAQLEEGRTRNEGLEGKTEEYSRSLGRDALEMVVGREEREKRKGPFYLKFCGMDLRL